MMRVADVIKLLFSSDKRGKCVVCGCMTTNTKARQFVCGYGDDNSMGCSEVWTERVARKFKTEHPGGELEWYHPEYSDHLNSRDFFSDYDSYILSYEWETKSIYAKRKAGYKCQRCGKKGNRKTIHTHHKHYRTLYHERLSDVEVLCAGCHKKHHGK